MCYNCGCGNPHDDMGHMHNITRKTLAVWAAKWGVDEAEVKKRVLSYTTGEQADAELDQAFAQAAAAWGQSVEEAKVETMNQLKKEAGGHAH